MVVRPMTFRKPADALGAGRDSRAPARPAGARPRAEAGPNGLARPEVMALWSYVTGLVGLLFANLVLGPCALWLGGRALVAGTRRRGRALAGLLLGVADLLVFAALSLRDGTPFWRLAG